MIDPVTLMCYPKTRDEFAERAISLSLGSFKDKLPEWFTIGAPEKSEFLVRAKDLATMRTIEIWKLDGRIIFRNEY